MSKENDMSFIYDEKTRARALQLINERRDRQSLPPMPDAPSKPTFKRGDRVRDLNHKWTPDLAEFGTVDHLDDVGSVYVDWDGAGVDPIPSDPMTLTHVK